MLFENRRVQEYTSIQEEKDLYKYIRLYLEIYEKDFKMYWNIQVLIQN